MLFDTESSLDQLIAGFEDGTWPAADWKHAHHLAMAACYVLAYGREEALSRARTTIQRYNEAQGGKNTEHGGYHETLTIFWIDVVAAALPAGATRLEAVHYIVDRFAQQRDLWRKYYSYDVVNSREARMAYVQPDLMRSLAAPED